VKYADSLGLIKSTKPTDSGKLVLTRGLKSLSTDFYFFLDKIEQLQSDILPSLLKYHYDISNDIFSVILSIDTF